MATTTSDAPGDVRIAVVDYGAGNLVSIGHALERVGAVVTLAHRPPELAGCAGIVVPGVGASGPAMSRLRRMGMVEALSERVLEGAMPYLGICLGMQLLFGRSDEDGARGLRWLEGPVRALPDAPRLPHIGWNQVDAAPAGLFAGVRSGSAFYFVHSYAPAPKDDRIVAGTTEHGGRFVSAVAVNDVFGVQFHPEKSGAAGLRVLANFVARAGAVAAGSDDDADARASSADTAPRDAATPPSGALSDARRNAASRRGATATQRSATPNVGRHNAAAIADSHRNAGAAGGARSPASAAGGARSPASAAGGARSPAGAAGGARSPAGAAGSTR